VTPVCVVDIVLQSTGAANPASWIGCDSLIRPPITFYQNDPATGATAAATSASATSRPAAGNSIQPGSAAVTQGTGTESGTLSSIPVSTQTISGSISVIYSLTTVPAANQLAGSSTSGAGHPKPSKAWIAGAVAGPIVVLLIVVALVVWILRSKRKGKRTRPVSTAAKADDYYQPPKEGHHEVSDTPAPITTLGRAELAGSYPVRYNYDTGSAGRAYTDYPVPQASPVELDATGR
jgi:hypothetical protein